MIPEAFSIGLVGLSVNYTARYFLNEFKHEFYTLEIGIIIFNSAWCPAGRIDLLDKTSLLNKKPVESRHKAADARARVWSWREWGRGGRLAQGTVASARLIFCHGKVFLFCSLF